MLCPLCKTVLVAGEMRRYETLDHHVCNTNDPCPYGDTVVCPNVACEASKDKVFWAGDGEGPYKIVYGKDYGWIDNNSLPFDSFHRAVEFSIYHAEDREWCNRLFMIRREVRYESNDHGDKVGRRVHYSLFIKSDMGGYTYYISGIRMFIHSLKAFYRNRSCYLDGKPWEVESYWVRNIKRDFASADWPRAEWWRKAARWWIRCFHGPLLNEMGIQ